MKAVYFIIPFFGIQGIFIYLTTIPSFNTYHQVVITHIIFISVMLFIYWKMSKNKRQNYTGVKQ